MLRPRQKLRRLDPGPTRRLSLLAGSALLTAALAALPAAADPSGLDHWPQWRGPLSSGAAPKATPPLRFGEKENLRFKVEVPGRGMASPVVWGDDIFLLTAVPAGDAPAPPAGDGRFPMATPSRQRFELIAFARQDGAIRWRRTVAESLPHEGHHGDGSFASASAATDGKRVIAHFGSYGTAAFSMKGDLLWKVDLGDMKTRLGFGEGSSPLLADDTVVILWDHEGESFIVALDAATGKEKWRQARPGERTSWSTPIAVAAGGRKQVVVPATGKSRGYDLATGEELWRLGGMTENVIPSAVAHENLAILMSGFRGNMLQAIDLAKAKGDLDGHAAIVYSLDRDTPYVPSPLLYQGQLYYLKHNSGILTAIEAATGKVHFKEQRLPEISNVYAAPVAADGRIYVVGRDGKIVVLRHGPALEVLASTSLDDRFDSTPALAGKDLILRGHKHLYVFAQPGG